MQKIAFASLFAMVASQLDDEDGLLQIHKFGELASDFSDEEPIPTPGGEDGASLAELSNGGDEEPPMPTPGEEEEEDLLAVAENVTIDSTGILSGTCAQYKRGYIAGHQPAGGGHGGKCVTKQECFARCAADSACKAVDMGENQPACGANLYLCNIRNCDPVTDAQCSGDIKNSAWGWVYSCTGPQPTCAPAGSGYIAGYQPAGGGHGGKCVTKQECFARCAGNSACKAVDMGENQPTCGADKYLCNIRSCDPATDAQCRSAIKNPAWGKVYSCTGLKPPSCPRPGWNPATQSGGWCGADRGKYYEEADCDGDGTLDRICDTFNKNWRHGNYRWIQLSSNCNRYNTGYSQPCSVVR